MYKALKGLFSNRLRQYSLKTGKAFVIVNVALVTLFGMTNCQDSGEEPDLKAYFFSNSNDTLPFYSDGYPEPVYYMLCGNEGGKLKITKFNSVKEKVVVTSLAETDKGLVVEDCLGYQDGYEVSMDIIKPNYFPFEEPKSKEVFHYLSQFNDPNNSELTIKRSSYREWVGYDTLYSEKNNLPCIVFRNVIENEVFDPVNGSQFLKYFQNEWFGLGYGLVYYQEVYKNEQAVNDTIFYFQDIE